MIDVETAFAVRDAVRRVLDGRETVPGDLPYPPAINEYVLAAAWPEEDPQRSAWSKSGRALARAARQVYVAGYLAGRSCDVQVGRQVREALGIEGGPEGAARVPHVRVGVAVCLVCDRAPEDEVHR